MWLIGWIVESVVEFYLIPPCIFTRIPYQAKYRLKPLRGTEVRCASGLQLWSGWSCSEGLCQEILVMITLASRGPSGDSWSFVQVDMVNNDAIQPLLKSFSIQRSSKLKGIYLQSLNSMLSIPHKLVHSAVLWQVHCQVYHQSRSCPRHGTCYWKPRGACDFLTFSLQ